MEEREEGGGVSSQYHNTCIRKGAEVTLVLNFKGVGLSVRICIAYRTKAEVKFLLAAIIGHLKIHFQYVHI